MGWAGALLSAPALTLAAMLSAVVAGAAASSFSPPAPSFVRPPAGAAPVSLTELEPTVTYDEHGVARTAAEFDPRTMLLFNTDGTAYRVADYSVQVKWGGGPYPCLQSGPTGSLQESLLPVFPAGAGTAECWGDDQYATFTPQAPVQAIGDYLPNYFRHQPPAPVRLVRVVLDDPSSWYEAFCSNLEGFTLAPSTLTLA